MELNKRQRLEIVCSQLESEISSFLPHWRDIGQNVLPYRLRFTVTEANRGDRKNQKIIDSTATLAARTLRAGMMGGVTSPARPWFRLTTPDPGLSEYGTVKDWLHTVSQRMSTAFLKSNLYNVLPTVYGDLGVFGTGAALIEEDRDDTIRLYSFPIGSYRLAVDARGRVNTYSRNFSQTVRQIVEKFGRKDGTTGKADWSNISTHVRSLWDRSMYDSKIEVVQVIMPNIEYNPRRFGSKFKKYASTYFESGVIGSSSYLNAEVDRNRFLRESGYDYFPVLAPRWEVTGDDPYGSSCPGMDSLGDIRQLHQGEKRIQEAIEKMLRPPMKGPSSLMNRPKSILPGDFTVDDARDGNQGFRPVFELDPRIQEMEMKQEQVRERIKRAFFEDLFLMMAYSDRKQITAREIEERHEEKLLALGPVLEQLNQDLLNPLIDTTFAIQVENGLIPPAPPELQGMPLKVEYLSIMAQAQKLVGVGGIERYAGFVTNLAQINPAILDKANFDQLADEYADAVGVSPKVNRSDEEVAEIRAAKAQAEQAQAQMMAMREGAAAAKDMSQAKLDDKNALTELVNGSGGASV